LNLAISKRSELKNYIELTLLSNTSLSILLNRRIPMDIETYGGPLKAG